MGEKGDAGFSGTFSSRHTMCRGVGLSAQFGKRGHSGLGTALHNPRGIVHGAQQRYIPLLCAVCVPLETCPVGLGGRIGHPLEDADGVPLPMLFPAREDTPLRSS